MHEVAIAQSLIAIVQKERANHGNARVVTVGLKIGVLSDVNPDSLEFGYQCLVAGTSLEGSKLSIERIPTVGKCRQCEVESRFDDFVFVCPSCSSNGIDLLSGQEIEIAWMNIGDTAVSHAERKHD